MELEKEFCLIKEFPNYAISRDGTIVNLISRQIKKISIGKRGYPVTSFRKNGKTYLRTIHIILARTFLENPNNYVQVNHIDGNKKKLFFR